MIAILPLVVAMTFGVIAFSMVFPLLPYMLRLHGVSEFWQVAVFSLFSLVSLVTSPLWGRLSDKIGRKFVITATMIGSMGCIVWLYFSASAVEIYLNRAVSGLFAGWFVASQAFIGDWVSQKDRVRGMALMGIAFGIGFTIGPFTTSRFIEEDWFANPQFFQPSLIWSMVCYVVAIAIVILFVKDTTKKPQEDIKLTATQVISEPAIAQALVMVILFKIVFTAMEGTLALWVYDRFGGGPQHVGMLLAAAGIASMITHGSIVGLGKRFHPITLAIAGMFCLLLALLSLVFSNQQWQAFIIIILVAIGHGLFVPSCSGFLSRLAPEGWQGGVMGFFQSSHNLSRTAGPVTGGWLYATLGSSLAYLALIVPLIPSLIFALRLWRHKL